MKSVHDLYREVLAADERIRPYVRETPLVFSPSLSERSGGAVYLKLENRQRTGSFKMRGATNKILSLAEAQRWRGVLAASTGNHGLAVAQAASTLDVAATIYLPASASSQKVAKLRSFPVALRFVEGDAVDAERAARRAGAESGQPYISPYNDLQVMAGQGTIGLELLRQQPALDAVLAAVGGGGLIGGIAGALKAVRPEVEIVGCLPENSPVMYRSVQAGRIVAMATQPTLSDGTAGGIEEGAIPFAICQQAVDGWHLVSEAQIAEAVRLVHREHGERIEGAAGVAVAALLAQPGRWQGRTVAVILCGGNIDPDTFRGLVS